MLNTMICVLTINLKLYSSDAFGINIKSWKKYIFLSLSLSHSPPFFPKTYKTNWTDVIDNLNSDKNALNTDKN